MLYLAVTFRCCIVTTYIFICLCYVLFVSFQVIFFHRPRPRANCLWCWFAYIVVFGLVCCWFFFFVFFFFLFFLFFFFVLFCFVLFCLFLFLFLFFLVFCLVCLFSFYFFFQLFSRGFVYFVTAFTWIKDLTIVNSGILPWLELRLMFSQNACFCLFVFVLFCLFCYFFFFFCFVFFFLFTFVGLGVCVFSFLTFENCSTLKS